MSKKYVIINQDDSIFLNEGEQVIQWYIGQSPGEPLPVMLRYQSSSGYDLPGQI